MFSPFATENFHLVASAALPNKRLMTKHESTFQQFVRGQLDKIGLSPRAASIAGGLKPDFIRDILSGAKRSVNGGNVLKLAAALQVPIEVLTANLPHTESLPGATGAALPLPEFRRIVPLLGDLKRGAWLHAGGRKMLKEGAVTSRDERYSEMVQEARIIADDSVDLIYSRGAIAIYVVDYKRVGIRSGSLLVVRRVRTGEEDEISVWQAIARDGRLMLSTASAGLPEQVVIPSTPEGDILKVEILGIVVTAMLEAPGLSGPMISAD